MVVPKSFPGLCTPYVQVVHRPWKCTVHKPWKCLHRWSVQEVSKSCKKCFVSKNVSKSVLHNSYVITVSKKCPSCNCALSKLGPNLMHVQILILCCTILFSMWGREQTACLHTKQVPKAEGHQNVTSYDDLSAEYAARHFQFSHFWKSKFLTDSDSYRVLCYNSFHKKQPGKMRVW